MFFQDADALAWVHFRGYRQTLNWIVGALWLRRVAGVHPINQAGREERVWDLRVSDRRWYTNEGLPLSESKHQLDTDATNH